MITRFRWWLFRNIVWVAWRVCPEMYREIIIESHEEIARDFKREFRISL